MITEMIMSEMRACTHLLASMQLTLEELAQRLNTLLFESTARKYFVSFFAAEIDTAHGQMRYVNAGHAALPPQPFVQQLLEEVKNFGHSQELDDDVAIAVTKFLP